MDNPPQRFSADQLLNILTLSENATAIYTSEQVTIQMANDAMISFWGKDRSVIGKPLEEAVPELKGQPFIGLLQNVWRTGITYAATNAPTRLEVDGILQTFYFDFTYRAILNEAGEVYCILHTAVDVTESFHSKQQVQEAEKKLAVLNRELVNSNHELMTANEELRASNEALRTAQIQQQQTHEALQQSEIRFRSMVEQSPVAMLVAKGQNMVLEEINLPMLEIIGRTAMAKGKPVLDTMPELKGQPIMEKLYSTFYSGIEWTGIEQPILINKHGQAKIGYYSISYKPLIENNQVTGVLQSVVDVTEQVLARQKLEKIVAEKTLLETTLRENEHRLQSILDSMAEGIGIIDIDGKLIYANQMAQRILGLKENEIKKRTYDDPAWQNLRVDGTPLPDEEHPMYIMMSTGKHVYDHEIGVQPPDRERFYISINAAPLFDKEGKLVGGIGTFMDVTARRKDLQYKDDFISIASHELKTPVTSLKVSLQLLSSMKNNPSAALLPRLVDQSNRSVEKISKLIDELMDASRLTQGQLQLNKTWFTIADMLNNCCAHVRTAGKHNLVLQGDEQLQIFADEDRIDQVIVNFVNNAVKYASDSTDIFLMIEKQDHQAKISVKDSGPGITAEKVPYLFQRYYQVQHGNGKQAGLGLGLYICAEIVHRHGGEIGVDTEVGKGSTFWFTLPLKTAEK